MKSAASGDIYLRTIDSHKSMHIKPYFGDSMKVSASINLFTFSKIEFESFMRLYDVIREASNEVKNFVFLSFGDD